MGASTPSGPAAPRCRIQEPAAGYRRRSQCGQGLIEYGLILVIMAVVCALALLLFGDQLAWVLSIIASAV